MKFSPLMLAAMLTLGACAPSTMLTNSFRAEDAAFINTKGKSTITGQAFLRRNDGMVVYAAGSPVNLVPKTPYSDERIAFIYKGSKVSYFGGTFKNDDPEYYKYAKTATADGEGRFTFTDLPAGSYYVSTQVIWMVQYERQGGALMEQVTVGDGATANVIMSGM